MEELRPGDPDRVGPYRLVARLGAGGMGVVYLGCSPGGLLVALKVVRARLAGDAEYRARFRREVASARTVSGAYTASVLDADPDAGTPWLATAYLPGLSLREAVAAHGRFPADTVRLLATGLAEALADIHRAGLTHRDLKPGNIMLTADGPRVIDFGIARPEDAVSITRANRSPGTRGFMSPEQAAGGEVGPASDMFSLGAVLAFAATGEESRADGREALSRSGMADRLLRDLIRDCRRRDRTQRPSAADLLTRLDPAVSAQGATWLPAGVVEAIDHRTAQARHLSQAPAIRPRAESVRSVAADPARMAEATADGQDTAEGGTGRGTSRRRLLLGGGALLAFAGTAVGVGAALSRSGGPDPGTAAAGPSGTPTKGRSPSVPPAPPPRAVSRWKVRVGDYYPDLFTTGGLVLAQVEGRLRALDPATGKTRWKHGSWGEDHVSAVGGDVFVYDPALGDGYLAMVRAASGADRWTHPGPPGKVPMYPVVGESVACYGYDSVTALDLDDGRPRWTAPVKAELGVAVDGDLVIAVDRTRVAALDIHSGGDRWIRPLDWGHYPQACYGLVFVCDGPGAVHALRAADGQPAWKRQVGETVYPSFGFASGGGVVFFGTAEGDVLALRATTGEVVWKRRLGAESSSRNLWNALGAAGDMLYVGGADRNVHALRGSDGRTEWTYPADVTVRTSPPVTVDGGMTFIGTAEGFVEALSPPAGA